VHRARTGLRIQLPTDPAALARLEAREEAAADEGGEAACLLPRLCPLTDQNPNTARGGAGPDA